MRKRIFWVELLDELGTARVTQKEIATKVMSSQPAISRLAKGETEEPPHSVGEALLALHREVCGEVAHLELLSRSAAAVAAGKTPVAAGAG